MKIISKYKDFYDYLVQDHDADLTYVRSAVIVNEYFDELFKRNGNSVTYYSKYHGYFGHQYYTNTCANNGDISFDNLIFGIYPFVFSQPIMKIHYICKGYKSREYVFIILGRELVDKILNGSTTESKEAIDNILIPMAQKEFDKIADKGICGYTKIKFSTDKVEKIKSELKSYVWKVDCPDVFYKIQSPVFVKYYYDLFINGVYWENWRNIPKIGTSEYIHYVTNISFQKLNYNILKYWYNDLFDLNTYINIENFLWSIKQEPESNPDNKTKILAHGFDLKTSFRKM